jgi:hypothetical protein
MRSVEQVEHAAGKREHRKSADAAWGLLRGLREEILEREA